MDPAYAVCTAGSTRIGRRIIAFLAGDHGARCASEPLHRSCLGKRAQRETSHHPKLKRTDLVCHESKDEPDRTSRVFHCESPSLL